MRIIRNTINSSTNPEDLSILQRDANDQDQDIAQRLEFIGLGPRSGTCLSGVLRPLADRQQAFETCEKGADSRFRLVDFDNHQIVFGVLTPNAS
ncbi:MAG: hypothetical protein AAGA73_00805 [Pseudomonadota bacterium]